MNLEWEKQCLEFHKNKRQVRTASIEQVRKPINNKSIGAWKKYERYLSEMLSRIKNNDEEILIIILAIFFIFLSCGFKPIYKITSDDISNFCNYSVEVTNKFQEKLLKKLIAIVTR